MPSPRSKKTTPATPATPAPSTNGVEAHSPEKDGEGELDDEVKNKERKHDSGAADLEKVTDYVEETEITTQEIHDAMKLVNEKNATEAAKKAAREKELSKVKISDEDVKLIAHEMEIPKSSAERKLREHGGDVVETLKELTQ